MRALGILLVFSLTSHVALAKPPLRDVAEIDDALLAVGLADDIRKNCPTISARMLKALSFVQGLQSRAQELGYSEDEIKAYRSSTEEKARLRAEGDAWLSANGVDKSAPETYCAAGQNEIKKQSQIGALLRVN